MASDAPKALNRLGQSLWLDNITRDLLDSGTLKRYIDELSVTGLTSNPTIFDNAISRSSWYDAEIREQLDGGASGEALFFNLAIQDLSRAADLFAAGLCSAPARWTASSRWRSRRCSPTTRKATVAQAKALHAKANKPNLFIKIPGTTGRPAGDRGGDLRRRAGERHPAVLHRTIQGRGRCLHEGAGAARRRRPVPRRALGRLAVRQPVGRRGGRQGAGRAAQHARHRGQQAGLQGLSRHAGERPFPAPGECRRAARSGCCSPAPAPRTRARRTRCTSPASRRRTR